MSQLGTLKELPLAYREGLTARNLVPLWPNLRTKMTIAEILTSVGNEIGVSKWIHLDQKRIDAFAELTEDKYFLHTDIARAKKETPFRGAIAHGFFDALDIDCDGL